MTRGGQRQGAGRKRGDNLYGEPTKPIRVPESLIPYMQDMLKIKASSPQLLPLYAGGVSAGCPLPADASLETYLDLNQKLIKNLAATFLLRANGESMLGAGIHDQDLLVVDRSLLAKNGDVIVAAYDGDLLVKRLVYTRNGTYLHPDNPAFTAMEVADTTSFHIWGVVTNVIHSLKEKHL